MPHPLASGNPFRVDQFDQSQNHLNEFFASKWAHLYRRYKKDCVWEEVERQKEWHPRRHRRENTMENTTLPPAGIAAAAAVVVVAAVRPVLGFMCVRVRVCFLCEEHCGVVSSWVCQVHCTPPAVSQLFTQREPTSRLRSGTSPAPTYLQLLIFTFASWWEHSECLQTLCYRLSHLAFSFFLILYVFSVVWSCS